MPLSAPAAGLPAAGGLTDYLRRSRSLTYGLLFTLPLLVAYETLAAAMNAGREVAVRNAADLFLRRGLAALGARSTLAASLVLVTAGALVVLRERRRSPERLEGRVFGYMLVESVALALLFGTVVGALTGALLGPLAAERGGRAALAAAPIGLGAGRQVVLALGAGLYEELVFRVLLIPALAGLLRWAGATAGAATAAAAGASALLFAAAHYVGPFGDPWALGTFTFRALGGLVFSLILVLRGFGIVAWTHALYDVFLVLAGAG